MSVGRGFTLAPPLLGCFARDKHARADANLFRGQPPLPELVVELQRYPMALTEFFNSEGVGLAGGSTSLRRSLARTAPRDTAAGNFWASRHCWVLHRNLERTLAMQIRGYKVNIGWNSISGV